MLVRPEVLAREGPCLLMTLSELATQSWDWFGTPVPTIKLLICEIIPLHLMNFFFLKWIERDCVWLKCSRGNWLDLEECHYSTSFLSFALSATRELNVLRFSQFREHRNDAFSVLWLLPVLKHHFASLLMCLSDHFVWKREVPVYANGINILLNLFDSKVCIISTLYTPRVFSYPAPQTSAKASFGFS